MPYDDMVVEEPSGHWVDRIPRAEPGDDLITVDEAAEIIGVTVYRVHQLVRMGAVQARIREGLIYILRESAKAYKPSKPRTNPKHPGRPKRWARLPLDVRRNIVNRVRERGISADTT